MSFDSDLLARIIHPPRILTSALGGELRREPEDFEVEELPSYHPQGEGDHLFLWVEKRAFPTEAVARELSKALRVPVAEVGTAGLKDTVAVTRQFVSVPRAGAEESGWDWQNNPSAMNGERFKILSAVPHGNKLRTGHLLGNRFRITIRPEKVWSPSEIEETTLSAERLTETGVPNYYGEQRFGRGGSTLTLGLDLLQGRSPRRISRTLRRLGLSALQSAVFNLVVGERLQSGDLSKALLGDVFQVCASGGPFVVEDLEAEQPRLDRREVVPAGPMLGKKMKKATGRAAELEASALEQMGLVASDFDIPGKLMLGTRRAMVIWPELVVSGEPDGIVVSFDLPKGSYATVVLRELMGEPRKDLRIRGE